jgi:hypothetical protein
LSFLLKHLQKPCRVVYMTKTTNEMNIGSPKHLRHGDFDGNLGTYWAWPVDGYWDLHHTERGIEPDGSEVIAEFYATLKEAQNAARELSRDYVKEMGF